jgi:hypothetical protein
LKSVIRKPLRKKKQMKRIQQNGCSTDWSTCLGIFLSSNSLVRRPGRHHSLSHWRVGFHEKDLVQINLLPPRKLPGVKGDVREWYWNDSSRLTILERQSRNHPSRASRGPQLDSFPNECVRRRLLANLRVRQVWVFHRDRGRHHDINGKCDS